jgi:LuxR family transcriptional regulator, maltose regulon positive regulatory protein
MFFRLLPVLAGQFCELALRWQIETPFVTEVIRDRRLPAPSEADSSGPWPVWVRMLGGFEIRLNGQPLSNAGKPQQKPLELLRLLACQSGLSMGMGRVADEIWPDADGAAGQKSLEMTALRLRRLLADDTLVRIHEGSVALDARRVGSDVLLRRALVRRLESMAMKPAPDPARAVQECEVLAQRLLHGARGELLPDVADTPWLDQQRRLCANDGPTAAKAVLAILARSGEPRAEQLLLVEGLRTL